MPPSRTQNLEAELLKLEKTALGKKWTRKRVIVDGARKEIRYHRPQDDKRTTEPRKKFNLADMLLDENVRGPRRAPNAFELRHRVTAYSIVLACEKGPAEHKAWCSVLAPMAYASVSLPPGAQQQTVSPRRNSDVVVDDDDDDGRGAPLGDTKPSLGDPALKTTTKSSSAGAPSSSPMTHAQMRRELLLASPAPDQHEENTKSLRELFPNESAVTVRNEYERSGRHLERATESLLRRRESSEQAANKQKDAFGTLARLFPALPEDVVRRELDAAGGDLEKASAVLLSRRTSAIRQERDDEEKNLTGDRGREEDGAVVVAPPAHTTLAKDKEEDYVMQKIEATFFMGQPLGIQLRLTPLDGQNGYRRVVILAVKPTCPAKDVLREGDALVESNGIAVPHMRTKQEFGDLTKGLARAARPLVLTFERRVVRRDEYELPPNRTDRGMSEDPSELTLSPGLKEKQILPREPEEYARMRLDDSVPSHLPSSILRNPNQQPSSSNAVVVVPPHKEDDDSDAIECDSTSWQPATSPDASLSRNPSSSRRRLGRLDLGRKEFQVAFHQVPLGFKLVLAQYSHERFSILLNEVTPNCTCFRQIQVLDELVAINDSSHFAEPEVRPESFDIATQMLRNAVQSQQFPLTLTLVRKAAVFSVDFPRKPLGLLLRLATIHGKKAVIVKEIQHEDHPSSPASALQVGDDRLIAVHGKLLPRQCDTEEFERLMLELKETDNWPLRLTFWRHSLGSHDEEEVFGDASPIPDGRHRDQEASEPYHTGHSPLATTDEAHEEDEMTRRLREQEETAAALALVEAKLLARKAQTVAATREEDDDILVQAVLASRPEVDDIPAPTATAAHEEADVILEQPPDEPRESVVSTVATLHEFDDLTMKPEKPRTESTLAAAAAVAMERVPAVKHLTPTRYSNGERRKSLLESDTSREDASPATKEREEENTDSEEETEEDKTAQHVAAAAAGSAATVSALASDEDVAPKTHENGTSQLAPTANETHLVKDVPLEETTPPKKAEASRLDATPVVEKDSDAFIPFAEPDKLRRISSSSSSRRLSKGTRVEMMAAKLEERIESQHPAYKKVTVSTERKSEAQELVDSLGDDPEAVVGVESAKKQLASAVKRPPPLERHLSSEELPPVGSTSRLSGMFDERSRTPTQSTTPPIVEAAVEEDELDESFMDPADKKSSGEKVAPSTSREQQHHQHPPGSLLQEELDTLRRKLERTSSELAEAKQALIRETALAKDRVGAAEAASGARVDLARLELGGAQREATLRIGKFQEVMRQTYVVQEEVDIQRLRAEASVARRDADLARLELEAAKRREMEAIAIARRDVDAAKRLLRLQVMPESKEEWEKIRDSQEQDELQRELDRHDLFGSLRAQDLVLNDPMPALEAGQPAVTHENVGLTANVAREEHVTKDRDLLVMEAERSRREGELNAELVLEKQAQDDQERKDAEAELETAFQANKAVDRDYLMMEAERNRQEGELDAELVMEKQAQDDQERMDAAAKLEAAFQTKKTVDRDFLMMEAERSRQEGELDAELALEKQAQDDQERMDAATELEAAFQTKKAVDRDFLMMEAERSRQEGELDAELALEKQAQDEHEDSVAAAKIEECQQVDVEGDDVDENEEILGNSDDRLLEEAKQEQHNHELGAMLNRAAAIAASQSGAQGMDDDADVIRNEENTYVEKKNGELASPAGESQYSRPAELQVDSLQSGSAEGLPIEFGGLDDEEEDEDNVPDVLQGIGTGDSDADFGDLPTGDDDDSPIVVLVEDHREKRDIDLRKATETEDMYDEPEHADSTTVLDKKPVENTLQALGERRRHAIENQTTENRGLGSKRPDTMLEEFEQERLTAQAELAAVRVREIEKIQAAKDELQRELEEVKIQARIDLDAELEQEKRAIEAARLRELEGVRSARLEIQEETRRELADIKEEARRSLDAATRAELDELKRVAEEVREKELNRIQQSREDIQMAARQQLEEVEATRKLLAASTHENKPSRESSCDALAVMHFQGGVCGVDLARQCLQSGLSPPPTCPELVAACLRQLATRDDVDAEWLERRQVGASLRALASVDDDALCLGDDGGWVLALDELVAFVDDVLDFRTKHDTVPFLVACFSTLFDEGVVPRAAFESWRGRNAAILSESHGGPSTMDEKGRRRRPSIALRQTDAWFAALRSDEEDGALKISPRNRLTTRELATPTLSSSSPRRSLYRSQGTDDAFLGQFPATAVEVEVARELLRDRPVSEELIERIADERPRGARVMAAALSEIDADDDAAFDAFVKRSSPALRAMLESDVSEQAAFIAVVAIRPKVALSDRLELLLRVGVVEEAGIRAWHAVCVVDAESVKGSTERQAEARSALLASEPFFRKNGFDGKSSFLEERLAAERSRVDAELARRLLDERSFLEKRIEQELVTNGTRSPRTPPTSPADATLLSSSFVAGGEERIEGSNDRIEKLEQRIVLAENRIESSETKKRVLRVSADDEKNVVVASPTPRGSKRGDDEASTPKRKPAPIGLPQTAQSRLRERFLALLCKPRGVLLEDDACLLSVTIEHSYRGSRCWCQVEITNASKNPLLDLKMDVLSDDSLQSSPLARRRRSSGSVGSPKESPMNLIVSVEEDAEDDSVIATLAPGAEARKRLVAECRTPFVVPPELTLRFETSPDRRRHAYAFRLPIAVPGFSVPDTDCASSLSRFKSRWDSLGSSNEHQIVVSSKTPIDDEVLDDLRNRVVKHACHAALVKGADRTKLTVTAATAVCCIDPPRHVSVLLRLEINVPAQACRITVRSSSSDAAAAFKNVIQALITSYLIM